MLRKILISVAVLAVAGAAFVGLVFAVRASNRKALANRPVPGDPPPVNVVVQHINPEAEVRDMLELPAVVEANRVVQVSAEVDGRIERIPFVEGVPVTKTDTLIYLNTDLLQADHDRARSDWRYASKQYERLAGLSAGGVVTDDARDRAASAKEMSAAALAAARARLERTAIRSPIDGVLNRVPVEVGEYVKVGAMVAEIVDIEVAKVVVEMPERDVGNFATGAQAEVEAGLDNVQQLAGEITYISELADPMTRATRMEITVKNKPRVLRSGQIVKVRLTRRVLRNVIMAPLAAVIPLESGHAVYVVEDDVAQRRSVELGMSMGQLVQVKKGLREGDRLIVAGYRFVGSGQRVSVVPPTGGEAGGLAE